MGASSSKIGSWTLHSELGRGGQSVIYKASKVAVDGSRDYAAIRRIQYETMSAEQISIVENAFKHEYRILKTLNSQHIASVMDSGQEPFLWMATDFIEGQSLGELLAQHGPLNEPDWYALAVGVLKGLSHAHSKKVIHQDIKPGNIMVSTNGNAILIDFGSASFQNRKDQGYDGGAGTPLYAAPERTQGAKGTTKSDIYSLGVTLLASLLGEDFIAENRNNPEAIFNRLSRRQLEIISRLIDPKVSSRASAAQALKLFGATSSSDTVIDLEFAVAKNRASYNANLETREVLRYAVYKVKVWEGRRPTYWEIYQRNPKRLLGYAETKEEADLMVAGKIEPLNPAPPQRRTAGKSKTVAIVLSILFGMIGADRFYLGHVGTGLLKFFTLGGVYIWWIKDIISLAKGTLKDAKGNPLV